MNEKSSSIRIPETLPKSLCVPSRLLKVRLFRSACMPWCGCGFRKGLPSPHQRKKSDKVLFLSLSATIFSCRARVCPAYQFASPDLIAGIAERNSYGWLLLAHSCALRGREFSRGAHVYASNLRAAANGCKRYTLSAKHVSEARGRAFPTGGPLVIGNFPIGEQTDSPSVSPGSGSTEILASIGSACKLLKCFALSRTQGHQRLASAPPFAPVISHFEITL